MAREPEKSAREIGKAKNEVAAGSKSGGTEDGADAKSGSPNASGLLKEQHRGLQATLAKRTQVNADTSAIVKEFAAAWLPHTAVEQEVLVPALKDAGMDEEKIAADAIQKDIVNLILADLLQNADRDFAQAKLEALAKQFDALTEGKDGEDSDLSAVMSSAEKSTPGLTAQMKARYERFRERFANLDESLGEAMDMLAPRRLSVFPMSRQNRREYEMSRYSNVRERDEEGRFMTEGGHSARGRYQDEDRRYSRGGPERDEYGRFMSEGGSRSRGRYDDEDERYSSRSTGRDRDDEGRFMSGNGPSRSRFQGDDDHYGPRSLGSMGRDRDEGRFTRRGGSEGRGPGGWFGDSEGHSEASRRGWDNPSHGESGWYGDSDGHSQASRRGWDNPRHGESGWYGDPDGHSEAARRGWEHGHEGNYRSRSSRYDDDDRRYESRRSSRYPDDDYERGNGGRGGWSGDPEGHSEASRRGWQNRR
jgi:hypothetical protein